MYFIFKIYLSKFLYFNFMREFTLLLKHNLLEAATSRSIKEWTLYYLEKRLHEFHCSSIESKEILNLIHFCISKQLSFFIYNLRAGEFHPFFRFMIFICTCWRKNSSVCINFLIGINMWMMFSSLFLWILTFPVCCLRLMPLIVVFNLLLKLKSTALFFSSYVGF